MPTNTKFRAQVMDVYADDDGVPRVVLHPIEEGRGTYRLSSELVERAQNATQLAREQTVIVEDGKVVQLTDD